MPDYQIMKPRPDMGLNPEAVTGKDARRAILVFESEAEAEALVYADHEPEGTAQ